MLNLSGKPSSSSTAVSNGALLTPETSLPDDSDVSHARRQSLLLAQEYVVKGAHAVQQYIEQAPDGLRVLCFVGGCGVVLTAVMGLLNIFDSVLHPIEYVVNCYQLIFGLITCILEANPSWFAQRLDLQAKLFENAKFLTLVAGRGLFYLFQGSLALSQYNLLFAIVGLYMLGMGLLCLAIQFGYSPNLRGAQGALAGAAAKLSGARGAGPPAPVAQTYQPMNKV